MSDSNNLAVKITADVQDLTAKFAVARANVNALTAEMNALARQSAQGILDPAGAAKIQQVAGEMLQARQAAAGMAAQLQAAGGSTESFAVSLSHMRGGVAGAGRELHSLFEELSKGNAGGADVTMLRLAQHVLGLSPAALVALGGVAALTAGLGYLAAEAIKTSNAFDSMAIGAKFAGNLDLPRERLQALTEALANAADISVKDAAKIVDGFARIPDIGNKINALGQLVHQYSEATGQDAVKAGEALAKVFDPNVSAEKLAQELRGSTIDQRMFAEATDRAGDANQIAAAKVKILTEQLGITTPEIAKADAAFGHSLTNMAAYSAMWEQGLDPAKELLEDANQRLERQRSIVAALNAQLAATPATPQQQVSAGLETAKKENPYAEQVDEARAKVVQLEGELKTAQQSGFSDQVTAKLIAGLTTAREKLDALTIGTTAERMQAQMQQIAATFTGTQTEMLTAQRAAAAEYLGIETAKYKAGEISFKEYEAAKRDVQTLDVDIQKSTSTDLVNAAKETNSRIAADTSLSSTERISLQRDTLTQLLANEQVYRTDRVSLEKDVNALTVQLAKERVAQTQAIARSNVETDIAISKMQIEAQKNALDTELAAHRVSAAQKLEVLKNLTQQEYALDLQQLNNELATLNALTPEYAKVFNQIRELKAKLVLDMAALDKQGAADAKRAAEEQAQAWQKAVGEIESAESTMLGDLLSKRKSFGQAALQAVGQLVDQEIQADVRAMTTRLLIQDQGLAATKAAEQGGLLWHELMQLLGTNATKTSETQKTAATEAGVTTRTATETAGNSSFFSLIAQAISRWFGGETAKTGATTTGAGTRTTTQAAADAAAAVTTKMTALEEINAYAATGAAAAGASVAAIPFYGWAMAGPTAEATYQELSSFATMLSFDRGAWEIPADTVAQVHAGEMVIPAEHSEAIRGALGGGAGFDALQTSVNAAAGVAGPGGSAGAPGAAATFHELLGPAPAAIAGIAAPGLDSQSVDRARSESLDQTRSITELQRTASESMRSELTERASSRAFTESIESVRADANLGLPDIAHASLRPEVVQSALLARSSDAAARPSASAEALRAASEGAGGDTFGDTHFTANFHAQEFDGKRITEHLQKMVRNAHPATLRPWLPRR